jgi:hypothetical protein
MIYKLIAGIDCSFMTATATSVKRWAAQDSLWLCLAIVLHALLLLIPALQRDYRAISVVPLNITLFAPAPIEKPFAEEPESKKTALPAVKNKTVALDDPPVTELASLKEPEDRIDQEPPAKEVILTTARLLDAADEIEWLAPDEADSRRLGVFVPQAPPENWRSGIGIEDNLFNGMVLPNKTEIVDRWLAADGSQNIVINTPGGHTLCGRARAWDPIQPLVEHVMQFRPCGGGGKRTFEITKRLEQLTVINSLAKSTTN